MRTEDQLLSVVAHIYETATDPKLIAGLATFIGHQFDAESAIIYLARKPTPHLELVELLSTTSNFDTWALSSYAQHYHLQDEFFSRAMRKGALQACVGQEHIDDNAFSRTEFCADFCERIGFFHVAGGLAEVDNLVGGIGLHKPRRAGPFNEADRGKLQLLLPHLQRAWQIRQRLAVADRERGMALDLIEDLGIGVILVGIDGRLLFVNRIAERVVQRGQGLSLRNGRLHSPDQRWQPTLDRMIHGAVESSAGRGTNAGGTLSLPATAGQAITVLIAPFRAQAFGYGAACPSAVVTFADPEKPGGVSEKSLMSAYRLTQAEARLLSAILQGQKLIEYANSAGISINTAKTLMQRVFHKTGANRQGDLIRMIAGNPVLRRDRER
jgi:DNA-binding CsgD family transcriptional regulator